LEWFYDDYDGDNFSELAKEKSTPSRRQWEWRRDAVAQAIGRVSPSVVAVQEVESRRVLWYLTRSLDREQHQKYQELGIESGDHFTEQDVGFLFRSPVDVLSISQRMQTRQMKASQQFYNLTKHLVGVFQIPVGTPASGLDSNGIDQGNQNVETITVLNLHLRANEEAEPLRRRQTSLAHLWVADAISRGENVIVLGDFNTEETGDRTRPESDLGVACGLHTTSTDDDLVDLTLRVPSAQRSSHLSGKQLDRILVSRSLLADDPGRPDLVFDAIQVRTDLAIRGGQDVPIQHWEHYWEIPEENRDLSDHYPIVATFKIR
ncbi:MAG: endonuclease/exonuclease/phosphatase family protein, partial [Planctomycetales bacterium]|nr:endonuclease/exonuclease/phosphatase family protein [Planctomycetales bacterium]